MDNIVVYKDNEYSWMKVNNYWFNYKMVQGKGIIIRTALNIEEENIIKFINFLDKFKEKSHIIHYDSSKQKYAIVVSEDFDEETIKKLLISITNGLKQINAKPACEKCGKISNSGFVEHNNIPIVLCYMCSELVLGNSEDDISSNYNEIMVIHQEQQLKRAGKIARKSYSKKTNEKIYQDLKKKLTEIRKVFDKFR